MADSLPSDVNHEEDLHPHEHWMAAMDQVDLPENSMAAVTIGDHEIALYHLAGGDICATSNICTHGQAYLTDGWLTEDGLVECPLHAGCFDVRSGAGQGMPIDQDLRTYPVRCVNGRLMIRISPD